MVAEQITRVSVCVDTVEFVLPSSLRQAERRTSNSQVSDRQAQSRSASTSNGHSTHLDTHTQSRDSTCSSTDTRVPTHPAVTDDRTLSGTLIQSNIALYLHLCLVMTGHKCDTRQAMFCLSVRSFCHKPFNRPMVLFDVEYKIFGSVVCCQFQ